MQANNTTRFGFWQRLRRRWQAADHQLPNPAEESSALGEELTKTNRGLRRLALLTDQNLEFLKRIDSRTESLEQTLGRLGPSDAQESSDHLSHESALWLLDELDKLSRSGNMGSLEHSLIDGLREKLQSLAGLTPIARLGETYDSQNSKIITATPDPDKPAGTTIDIICQGYFAANGARLRDAIVAVTSQDTRKDDL
jgi:molecular chaperone GrpE (heat shock protein)